MVHHPSTSKQNAFVPFISLTQPSQVFINPETTLFGKSFHTKGNGGSESTGVGKEKIIQEDNESTLGKRMSELICRRSKRLRSAPYQRSEFDPGKELQTQLFKSFSIDDEVATAGPKLLP